MSDTLDFPKPTIQAGDRVRLASWFLRMHYMLDNLGPGTVESVSPWGNAFVRFYSQPGLLEIVQVGNLEKVS